jgi:hypothetical protein
MSRHSEHHPLADASRQRRFGRSVTGLSCTIVRDRILSGVRNRDRSPDRDGSLQGMQFGGDRCPVPRYSASLMLCMNDL